MIRVLVVWCVCYTVVSLVLGLLVVGAAWWEQRARGEGNATSEALEKGQESSAENNADSGSSTSPSPAPVRDEFYIEKLFESAGIRGGMVNRE